MKPDKVAIQERVVQALEARWNLLLDPKTPLETFYHPTSDTLAATERERFERHYLQPAREAGFKYTGVELEAEIKSVEVAGDSAQVTVNVVDVTYTSAYPDDPSPIVTKEAGLEHIISVVLQGNEWYIADDRYFDAFAKQGTKGLDVPLLRDDEVSDASSEANTSGGVVPCWYHYYNRSGAVNYADTWWNSSNPNYRYFSGNDCANYVSQCFDNGGQALMAWASPYIWWYNFHGTSTVSDDTWSTSWSVPHDQAYNLSRNTDQNEMRGSYVSSAGQLALGDSIYYDFNDDGILDHSAIVVEFRSGESYVNYHTNNTYHRHWNLGAPTTRFLHVTDWFWIN